MKEHPLLVWFDPSSPLPTIAGMKGSDAGFNRTNFPILSQYTPLKDGLLDLLDAFNKGYAGDAERKRKLARKGIELWEPAVVMEQVEPGALRTMLNEERPWAVRNDRDRWIFELLDTAGLPS